MANFREDGDQSQPGSSPNAVLLTAAKYFGKDGSIPYDSTDFFLTHGKKLKPSDVEGMRKGIGFINEGLKTDGGSELRKDIAGMQYIFYTFFKAKSRPGVKLVLTPGLVRLMSDYQNGLITIDFTLDDLIAEAKKGSDTTAAPKQF